MRRTEAQEGLFLVVPNQLDALALCAYVGERLSDDAELLRAVGEQLLLERVDVVKRSIPVARLGGVWTWREDQGADEVDN